MEIAFRANKTNVIVKLTCLDLSTLSGTFSCLPLNGNIRFDQLTCKTLPSGTGWIYLV